MTKLSRKFIFFIVLIVSFQIGAQTTIYDNFGEGNGGFDYNYQMGWTVCGIDHPTQYGVEQAMLFTSTETGTLSDIWVAMFSVPDNVSPDTVYVRLVLNTNGAYPDPADIMEEWMMTGFDDWSSWHPPVHLESNGNTNLFANEEYWIWMAASDQSNTGWCMNLDGSLCCPHTLRREGEDWLSVSNETASAFRVDVETFDPEMPASPSDLIVTPDPTGALNCDLSWSNPSLNYIGEPLTELLEMRLYRDSVLIYTDNAPIIGGSGSYTDIPDESGLYNYHVTAYNSYGESSAICETVWVGEAYNGILILDLDPTPTGMEMKTAIENFYTGSIEISDNVFDYPITSSVDAIFVLLGMNSENHVLEEEEALLLANYLDAGGNLYMEGGDTWFADDQTSLHPYFNIDPIDDGNSDLVLIEGCDFLTGMNWIYSGENASVDHIDPISPAITIFQNELLNYNCGIAYNSGNYKTIGTSFELSGISGTNSLEDAVECILSYFDLYVGVENQIVNPSEIVLHQNYPNPFNPTTTISFDVTQSSDFTTIEIYNLKGQKIKTFPNLQITQSQNQQIVWNGTDDNNKPVSSGVYFYKLNSGNQSLTRKMILMK